MLTSSAWKTAFRVIAEKEFPVFALPELQFEMLIAYQGKTRVIPELHWLRSFDAPPVRDTDVSLVETNGFDTWWRNDEKTAERNEFLEIMAAGMEEIFGHSKEWLRDRITASFDAYLDVFLPSYREFLAARGGDEFQPLAEGIGKLEAEGVRVDHEQLAGVESLLKAFSLRQLESETGAS